MENCVVKIKQIYIENPIFDDIADCTYVVLCCGDNPKRLPNVIKNIHILNPTTTVKLIYNKGFKDCPFSNSVNNDLVNIQSYIFRDAINNNYNRILYLEDDFTLKYPIKQEDYLSINKFISKHNPDVYGMGNFAFPRIDYIFSAHEKVVLNFLGMAHCVFYNKNYMYNCLEYYKENSENTMPDLVTKDIKNIEAYRYYKPLVYQTFPSTDNQKNGWAKTVGNFLTSIIILSIKLLGLDNRLEPGYTITYIIPYVFYLIIVLFLFFLIKFIIKKVRN
tara:strand:+ start:217 stop:1044 length:828 start_codon:yes stop_codon:yes gene_type:complete